MNGTIYGIQKKYDYITIQIYTDYFVIFSNDYGGKFKLGDEVEFDVPTTYYNIPYNDGMRKLYGSEKMQIKNKTTNKIYNVYFQKFGVTNNELQRTLNIPYNPKKYKKILYIYISIKELIISLFTVLCNCHIPTQKNITVNDILIALKLKSN
jgi:hypothetical protein